MKQSTVTGFSRARLGLVCFFAMSILFLASSSRPWAAEKLTTIRLQSAVSTNPDPNNSGPLKSPSLTAGSYTLNKFVYPGSTGITLPTTSNPNLIASKPTISNWSTGVPLLYVITIQDPSSSTTPKTISLTDDLGSALNNSQFHVLNVACNGLFGATCVTVPPATTTAPPLTFGFQIVGGGEIVVQILGYYDTAKLHTNTAAVFDSSSATTPVATQTKTVTIQNSWSTINLGISKTKPSAASSTSLPTTLHYKLVLTGDPSEDFYPTGLIQIQDTIKVSYPPTLNYGFSIISCSSSSLASTCPTASSSTSQFVSGGYYYKSFNLQWSGSIAVIKKGDSLTIMFDVTISNADNCGPSNVTVDNTASLVQMNGAGFSDSNNSDNSSTAPTTDSFTTGLVACVAVPAVASATKSRVCPSSGCPPVNWGDTVPYQIVVTNNTNIAQPLQVVDNVSKGSITAPLTARLMPTGTGTDVQCTPSTIACTTTSSSPQQVINDNQSYTLFKTLFTLPANGTVTLKFDVKIDGECQTDKGNLFHNSGTLWNASSSATVFIGDVALSSNVPVNIADDLPACKMKVTKDLVTPLNGVTFGQPVSYTITYENEASQPVTVRTLRDVLNMSNSGVYGNIPITGLVANCTASSGVAPLPITSSTSQIYSSSPAWQGITLIQEPAGGITFPANTNPTGPSSSFVKCTVTFTPQAPSATDNLCQGAGNPEIVNSAYMDVSGLTYWGVKPSSPYFDQATAPLPLCRSVLITKTPTDANGNAITSTGPGGILTFQIKVNNYGANPVENLVLTDPLPSGFVSNGPVTCSPPTACLNPGFTGQTLNVTFAPIPGTSSSGNQVTISFQVKAPIAGGKAVNTATASFTSATDANGTPFYFEGDPNIQLVNSAEVQVLTPVLNKSFTPNNIAVNGTAVATFTITNMNSDPAQTGISFTDLLPSGVTVTSAPSTACGGTVAVSGGNSIILSNGTLAQGQHQCQFAVNVKASSCGAFVNDQTNFSHVTNLDVTNAKDTLTVTGCLPQTESCPVKTNEISCKADGTGGYLHTFTVTNNTGHVVTDVLLTPAPGSGITLNPTQPPLPAGGLTVGASLTVQVTISGGQPNQQDCFDVTLMTRDGECCTTRVCPVLPECCAVIKDESTECNSDGTFTHTLSIVNTGVNTIEHIYLYPPAGVTMTPNYFAVSLKAGDTFTTKVTIKGAKPGDKLCFNISLHTANMENCCQGEQCIVLPACPVSGSRRP